MNVSFSVTAESDIRSLGVQHGHIIKLLQFNTPELINTIPEGKSGVMAGPAFCVVFHRSSHFSSDLIVDTIVPNHRVLRYS